jgi:hypothetical protein
MRKEIKMLKIVMEEKCCGSRVLGRRKKEYIGFPEVIVG